MCCFFCHLSIYLCQAPELWKNEDKIKNSCLKTKQINIQSSLGQIQTTTLSSD